MIRVLLLFVLALFIVPSVASADSVPTSHITCNVWASSNLVKAGEKVTVSWASTGSILTFGPKGEKIAPLGSIEVTPTKRTIYKFKFVGIGGNEKCGVRVRVIGDEVVK